MPLSKYIKEYEVWERQVWFLVFRLPRSFHKKVKKKVNKEPSINAKVGLIFTS
jgi:hypothetical protein